MLEISLLAHNSNFGLYFNSLTGVSPFWNNDPDITLSNVTRAEWNVPDILFQDVSDEAKDFLSKVLVKDPRYIVLPHEPIYNIKRTLNYALAMG